MFWSLTHSEGKAVLVLAGLFALRMLALFMLLPLLPLYAEQFGQATSSQIGWVIGIYGLSQAVFQIPLSILSDRIGRKPILVCGLILFCLGSLIAAQAESIHGLLIGRGLQGAGAIGSTLLALCADVTREEVRTKAMAVIGMTIGMSFMVAMVLGPWLSGFIGLNGLFWFTFVCGLWGLWFVRSLPDAPPQRKHSASFLSLLKDKQLKRLNISILVLHAQFSSCFLFIPHVVKQVSGLAHGSLWQVYLPAMLGALVLMAPFFRMADQGSKAKTILVVSVLILGCAECFLGLYSFGQVTLILALMFFFASFSLLEAQLPSWASKSAPQEQKGAALGLYSTSQFFGIFIGGVVGGWLQATYGVVGVIFWCLLLVLLWLLCILDLATPQREMPTVNV